MSKFCITFWCHIFRETDWNMATNIFSPPCHGWVPGNWSISPGVAVTNLATKKPVAIALGILVERWCAHNNGFILDSFSHVAVFAVSALAVRAEEQHHSNDKHLTSKLFQQENAPEPSETFPTIFNPQETTKNISSSCDFPPWWRCRSSDHTSAMTDSGRFPVVCSSWHHDTTEVPRFGPPPNKDKPPPYFPGVRVPQSHLYFQSTECGKLCLREIQHTLRGLSYSIWSCQCTPGETCLKISIFQSFPVFDSGKRFGRMFADSCRFWQVSLYFIEFRLVEDETYGNVRMGIQCTGLHRCDESWEGTMEKWEQKASRYKEVVSFPAGVLNSDKE